MNFFDPAKAVKRFGLITLAALLMMGVGLVQAAAEEPVLRLDAAQSDEAPDSFRMLPALSVSGSAQFSEGGLKEIRDSLPDQPIIVVDLRQESHGFVNGAAVSWYGDRNWANLGKSPDEVRQDEMARLNGLAKGETAVAYKKIKRDGDSGMLSGSKGTSFEIQTVSTEEQVAESMNIGYFRLPVTDHRRPRDEDVDAFLAFIRTVPSGTWLHFHCEAGHGRTTTFLAMVDMLHNAKTDGFEAILARQHAAGGINLLEGGERGWRAEYDAERTAFLRKFYEYCQANRDGYATNWSAWMAGQ